MPKFVVLGPTVQAAGVVYWLTDWLTELYEIYIDTCQSVWHYISSQLTALREKKSDARHTNCFFFPFPDGSLRRNKDAQIEMETQS